MSIPCFYRAIQVLAASGVLLLAACERAANDETSQQPFRSALVKRSCEFPSLYSTQARCYSFYSDVKAGQVASLLREGVKGETAQKVKNGFVLPVVVLRSPFVAKDSEPNIVVKVPGGPGQGYHTIAEEIEYWQYWMSYNRVGFDLMLFDPRGTGDAIPRLSCEAFDVQADALMAKNIDVVSEMEILNPVVFSCLHGVADTLAERFENVGRAGAMSEMSSFQQAQDISDITQHLGYESVAIWGVSYGTRVGLLAAKYPHVKALLLDSPYAFEHGKLDEWPGIFSSSLPKLAKLYNEKLPVQKRQLPAAQAFYKLYDKAEAQLAQQPLFFELEKWDDDGGVIPFMLTPARLADVSFDVLYVAEDDADVFFVALEEIIREDVQYEALTSVLESFVNNLLDPGFSYMTFFSVECLDNAPVKEEDYLAQLKKFPRFAPFLEAAWTFDSCRLPLFDKRSPVQREKYEDVPTLIFAGEHDPVTPIEWAQKLDAQLINSELVTISGVGHASVELDAICGKELLKRLALPLTPNTFYGLNCSSR